MNKPINKKHGCTVVLFSGAGEESGNISHRKSSNQIVEELKNKGIHAEVCKRYSRL